MIQCQFKRFKRSSVTWILYTLALWSAMVLAHPVQAECRCPVNTQFFQRIELFFGRNFQGQEIVDDESWNDFLANTVTPLFPDGLTVLDAYGQWLGTDGLKRERAKVLIILAKHSTENKTKIDHIVDNYKTRFQQESVLLTLSDNCVAF